MIKTTKIDFNGNKLDAISIKTENSIVLLVKAKKGMLGCGYFSIDAANKLGDALAVVTGVNDFDQMLAAQVKLVSDKARELGVSEGMSGKQALEKMI